MACNRPVVSTDVGDVKQIFNDVVGCFISEYNAESVLGQIQRAFSVKRTNGRSKIKHLNSQVVAKNIIEFYSVVIEDKNCTN
jgi:glycosyltransferase involved in cell wall biosynthesis